MSTGGEGAGGDPSVAVGELPGAAVIDGQRYTATL